MNTRINYQGKMSVIANQYKKEKEYWLQKIAAPWVKSNFPYDNVIAPDSTASAGKKFETAGVEFSPELFIKLMEISKRSDHALYVILMAGLVSLLDKYTGNKDIIVGAPIFKQRSQGEFINTVLAIRSRLEENITFKQLLLEVRELVVTANENMNFPIEILLHLLDIPYKENEDFPLFDTVILLETIHEKSYIDHIHMNMIFSFQREEANIYGTVQYNAGLYSKATVQSIISHYTHWLHRVLLNLDQPLSAIDILQEEEREKILYTFNNTQADFPGQKTIHRLFEEQAEKRPDQIAVVSSGEAAAAAATRQITYRELNEKSFHVAHWLIEKGVQPDTIIGIMMERSIEMITGILGILKAGGAYLPIDPDYPQERIDFMLKDSNARILINKSEARSTKSETNPNVQKINDQNKNGNSDSAFVLNLEHLNLNSLKGCPRRGLLHSNHLAYVIYTSGSTGRPKGALITHHSLVNRLHWMQKYYPLSSSDTILQKTPYTFDVSVWELLWWALEGARLCFLKPGGEKEPALIIDVAAKEKITVMHFVPSMLNAFLGTLGPSEIKKLSGLKQVFASGEALTPAQVNRFNDLLFKSNSTRLANLYGPTEATVDVSYFDCTGIENFTDIPIGKPIDNIRLYVLDETLRLQPVGIPGELCISGVGVSRGYLNKPELTAEKFVSDPFFPGQKIYKTGDIAAWTCEGQLRYRGRKDHQVKIRGFRIEIGEIEDRLNRIENVKEAVVDIKENENGDRYLCAYVIMKESYAGPGIETYLRESLHLTLPDYMVPTYFVFMEKLPLTGSGKLDRKALPQPVVITNIEEYAAPRNEIERKIAGVWQEVLGIERLGIKENFFKIGGDSIKAIRTVSTINTKLHKNLLTADLYDNQTIELLSKKIEAVGLLASHENNINETLEEIAVLKKRYIENGKMTPEIEDVYPMSDIEKGMMYYYLKDPEEVYYYEQLAFDLIYKDFDVEIFKKALFLMTDKHPSFRTGYDLQDFVHLIYRQVNTEIPYYDISHLDKMEQRAHILSFLEKNRREPLTLLRPPLWRMCFFHLGMNSVIFTMEMHHVVLDGWSATLFLTELNDVYLKLKTNPNYKPVQLHCGYRDFIVSEITGKKKIENRNYWENELMGYKRFEFPEVLSSEKEYKEIHIDMGAMWLERLGTVSAKYNTTIKHLCFGAYVYALSMISYDNDIVLGIVSNNRPLCEDGDKLLGCFLNTVPVRIQVPVQVKWSEYIKQIDAKLVNLKKYDMVPLNEILDITGEKSQEGNPIFDLKFNFMDFYLYNEVLPENFQEIRNQGLSLGSYLKENTLCDLNVDVSLDKFCLVYKYSTAIVSDNIVRKLCVYFEEVLNKYVNEPGDIISYFGVMGNREKQELLNDFNRTDAWYQSDKTIYELFAEQVERTPNTIAVFSHGQTRTNTDYITYFELNKQSNHLAGLLIEKGVQPDTIVAIMLYRSVEMMLGIMGILKAGGAYLPIDPGYPQERIDFMLKDSNAKLTVNYEFLKEVPQAPLQHSSFHAFSTLHSNHLAYVIYTSGSTGKPKGTLVEHHSLVNRLSWMQKYYPLSSSDTILQKTPYTFDVSVWELLWWGMAGAKVCFPAPGSEKDPAAIIAAIEKEKITVIHFVPPMLNAFLNWLDTLAIRRIRSLKQVFASGEALTAPQTEKFNTLLYKNNSTRLANLYGPTEATIDVSYFDCTGIENPGNIPIGKPIDNIRLYILNKVNRLQPVGVPGELYIAGVGVARGYLNKPELTQKKFNQDLWDEKDDQDKNGALRADFQHSAFILNGRPRRGLQHSAFRILHSNFYRTGDLARWLPDGNIEFMGRLDHQVKIRGFRIETGEIENRLNSIENVKEAVVICIENENAEKSLCAYVVMDKQFTGADAAAYLRDALLKSLPEYMIPAYFILLEKIPLTPNGKIDRKMLPKPGAVLMENYTAPRDEIETKVTGIWQDVLGMEKIGIYENFFNIGGDSIRAIKLLGEINTGFNKNLKAADLFKYPTIEKLSCQLKSEVGTLIDEEKKEAQREIEALKNRIIPGNKLAGEIEDVYPMSDIQKGMVYHYLKERAEAVYHDQMVYRLKYPDFTGESFEKALAMMVRKHGILRTSFNMLDFDEPVQVVYKDVPIPVKYYDLTGKEKHQQETFIAAFMADDRKNPIITSEPPLWRMGIFFLDRENIAAVWIFHHAVLDGWSNASLMTELNNTYLKLQSKEFFKVENLSSTYKDYIIEQIAEKKRSETIHYWKSELADYKRLALGGIERGATAKNPKMRYIKDLGKPLLAGLKDTARKYNTSIKNLCFGAYLYMLYMFSYENDITVGLVTNNRPVCPDGEKILGCFLNTLPVRIKIPNSITWSGYIGIIEQKIVELKKYDKLSLPEIVKIVGEPTDTQNPFFDTVFNFVDFHVFNQVVQNDGEADEDGMSSITLESHENTNDLFGFTISTTFGRFVLNLSYSLVKEKMALDLCRYFECILNKFAGEPDHMAGKNSLIPDEEKKKLLHEFNNNRLDYPIDMTIYELFEKQVIQTPDNIGVVYEEINLTYREIDRDADRVAHALRERGIKPGDIAAVMIERSIELIISLLGILKSGAAYLPIDPGYPQERIDYMLKDSGTKLLAVVRDQEGKKVRRWEGEKNFEIVYLDSVCFSSFPTSYLPNFLTSHPFNLAYVIYTSGSTGRPKGAAIRHKGFISLIYYHRKVFGENHRSRMSQVANMSFDAMAFEVWPCLSSGACLHIAPDNVRIDPAGMKKWLLKNAITISFQTTIMGEQLLEQDWTEHYTPLKELRVAGDRLSRNPARKYPFNFYNLYGPTEDTVWTTWAKLEPNDKQDTVPGIGKPVGNKQVYILGINGELQPLGIPGELCISGDGLAMGYLNRPELTFDKFDQDLWDVYDGQDKNGALRADLNAFGDEDNYPHSAFSIPHSNFYRTGDLARWLEDGSIEFLGRIDHQVKLRGFRIETGEIENRLLAFDKIKNAVVTLKEEKDGNKHLTAYIAVEEKPDISTLKKDLAQNLPAYMIPTHFVFLDTLPLTANGKIDLKALGSYNVEVNAGVEYIEPRNEIEKQIAILWKEVLNLTVNPGVNDNFFELGGNSLTIMRLNGKINSALNRDIPVLTMFEYPTIALMAEYLNRGEKTGEIESQALDNVEESMAETMRFFEQEEK